jgi:hypothetical protein
MGLRSFNPIFPDEPTGELEVRTFVRQFTWSPTTRDKGCICPGLIGETDSWGREGGTVRTDCPHHGTEGTKRHYAEVRAEFARNFAMYDRWDKEDEAARSERDPELGEDGG